MSTLAVVEHLDEFEDCLPRLFPRREATLVDELGLQGGEEALRDGIDAPMLLCSVKRPATRPRPGAPVRA